MKKNPFDTSSPDHLVCMEAAEFWPGWPRLPLKRPREQGQWPDMAILVDFGEPDGESDIRFIEGNMFMITQERLKAARSEPAADIRKLISEGWRVD